MYVFFYLADPLPRDEIEHQIHGLASVYVYLYMGYYCSHNLWKCKVRNSCQPVTVSSLDPLPLPPS